MKIKEIKESFGKFLNTFKVKNEEIIPSLVILVLMKLLGKLIIDTNIC